VTQHNPKAPLPTLASRGKQEAGRKMRKRSQPRAALSQMARAAMAAFAILAVSACAGIDRPDYSAAASDSAAILQDHPNGRPIRFWAQNDPDRYDAWRAGVIADRAGSGLDAARSILVISGGADKGAFSAGLLNAWSERGGRPSFDLVTGVSTGALIAPFAFLGGAEDARLKDIYTGIDPQDVFRTRALGVLFGSPGLARTDPLEELITRNTPPDLIARIATEHRKGRRLLVMTTHLDAGRGMIWDMGAIARSSDPRRLELFRSVLLASASVPGLFAPVMIEVSNGAASFSEMHVDGGAISSFFVLPLGLLESGAETGLAEGQKGRLWILYNGRLTPEFEVVNADILSILQRSLDVVLSAHDRFFLENLRQFGRANDVGVSVCSIKQDIAAQDAEPFDNERMNQFYALGIDAGDAAGCLDEIETD
jgi:hypothetical protein